METHKAYEYIPDCCELREKIVDMNQGFLGIES